MINQIHIAERCITMIMMRHYIVSSDDSHDSYDSHDSMIAMIAIELSLEYKVPGETDHRPLTARSESLMHRPLRLRQYYSPERHHDRRHSISLSIGVIFNSYNSIMTSQQTSS